MSFHKLFPFTMYLCTRVASEEAEEPAVPMMYLKWTAVMGTSSEGT